ncbi:MAG: phosphate ABC transporter permease PstA [Streptosporangiales bacterium]|nr:phosphate ABC transporter permease PstA [Streptosporangiales bacterium]
MSVAPAPPKAPPHGSAPFGLHHRRLPRWAVPAVVVAAVAVAVALRGTGLLSGTAQLVLVAALLSAVGVVTVSATVEGGRHARNRLATALVGTAFLLALLPLLSVLWEVVANGIEKMTPYFFTRSMLNVGPLDDAGGLYHAMVGTLEQVGLATLIAVPIGLLTAIYLAEYGGGPLARAVTFFVDVMTGIPSIVAGLFVLSAWILTLGMNFSGFAGALALTILMLPIVVRSAEEMLRLVPNALREASLALGVPRWRTILKVVLPTSFAGIITGVMLAVARVAGETAPLLLVVFGFDAINFNPFQGEQSALPLMIYQENAKGLEFSFERAWGTALALILLIMALNLGARIIAYFYAPKNR